MEAGSPRAQPNKRLKLAGADRFKGNGVFVPGRAPTVVRHYCAGGRVARSLSAIREAAAFMISVSHPVFRACALGAAFAAPNSFARAQAPVHLESRIGWSHSSVSNAVLDARLRGAAVQYRSYAPVPRIAFFDIAYPKDSAEATTTRGYALLVVTAVVQDSTELPIPRLYVRSAGGDRALLLLARVASWVPTTDTTVRLTFGQFRLDALYLLPMDARMAAGDLLADFAAHRQGFRLAHFAGDIPEPVRRLKVTTTSSEPPPASNLWVMVRREYPDLAAALVPSQ